MIGAQAYVRLIGPNASLNNLPTAEEFLTVFGRLQIRDLDFTVTGSGLLEVIGILNNWPGDQRDGQTSSGH